MGRVHADNEQLRAFSGSLNDKMNQLRSICEQIEGHITKARSEWLDDKAEQFYQAYQGRGKQTIENLIEVMSRHKSELDTKLAILDQYLYRTNI